MIEKIGKLAIIIRKDHQIKDGTTFLSKEAYSQQIGLISHKQGYYIPRHFHNKRERKVFYTQEVLMVRKGIVVINFYDDEKKFFDSRMLTPGDIVHLISGGHGLEFHTEAEIIEIKQGPYSKKKDKTRF